MKKIDVYKGLAVLLLLAILFTPQHSKMWVYFLIPGLVFGTLWFTKLK